MENRACKRMDAKTALAIIPLASLDLVEFAALLAGWAGIPLAIAIQKDRMKAGLIGGIIPLEILARIFFHTLILSKGIPAVKG